MPFSDTCAGSPRLARGFPLPCPFCTPRAFPVRLQSTVPRHSIRPPCGHTERRYALCRGACRGIPGPTTPCIPKSYPNMQPHPSGTARAGQAHARAYAPRCGADFFALGTAPCTLRPHPMIYSRSPPARALMQRPAQKRRPYAGKQAPPCRKLFGPQPRLPGKAVFRHAHKTHFLPPAPCPVIRKKPGRCAARLHMVLTA